jgi:hypothetical protein
MQAISGPATCGSRMAVPGNDHAYARSIQGQAKLDKSMVGQIDKRTLLRQRVLLAQLRACQLSLTRVERDFLQDQNRTQASPAQAPSVPSQSRYLLTASSAGHPSRPASPEQEYSLADMIGRAVARLLGLGLVDCSVGELCEHGQRESFCTG